jgi:hypothetical protein
MALEPFALILCLHVAVYHITNKNEENFFSSYLQRYSKKLAHQKMALMQHQRCQRNAKSASSMSQTGYKV